MFSKAKTPHRPRGAKRYTSDVVRCNLGKVLDLSRSGIRLRIEDKTKYKEGQRVSGKIGCMQGAIKITGVVRWVKRVKRGVTEIGMVFLNVDPKTAEAIEILAQYGFIERPSARKTEQPKSDKPPVKGKPNRGPDLYALLGLKPGASSQQIKHAYRVLAKRYHPDTAPDEQDAAKFIAISAAYEVLSDPEQRKDYDRER